MPTHYTFSGGNRACKTLANVAFAIMRAAASGREERCLSTLTPEEFHGYAKATHPNAQLNGNVVFGPDWRIEIVTRL